MSSCPFSLQVEAVGTSVKEDAAALYDVLWPTPSSRALRTFPVDIKEGHLSFIVNADIPGVRDGDVNVIGE
jgi:HSP20 family molecular chaperone IbpA